MYELMPPDLAAKVLLDADVDAAEIPSYGLLVRTDVYADPRIYGHTFLIFRKTTGEILVIDVTGAEPESFYQKMPAPASFWSEFLRRSAQVITDPASILDPLALESALDKIYQTVSNVVLIALIIGGLILLGSVRRGPQNF